MQCDIRIILIDVVVLRWIDPQFTETELWFSSSSLAKYAFEPHRIQPYDENSAKNV